MTIETHNLIFCSLAAATLQTVSVSLGASQAVATELMTVTACNNGTTVIAAVVREAAMTDSMPLKCSFRRGTHQSSDSRSRLARA